MFLQNPVMRASVIFLVLFHSPFSSYCQKKLIEFSSAVTWPAVSNIVISNNGKFVAYQVKSDLPIPNLIIQDSGASWKIDLHGALDPIITDDSRNAIFKIANDSLGFVDLESHTLKKMGGVENFKVLSREKTQWVAYQFVEHKKGLLLENLLNGQQILFPSIKNYLFNSQDESILLQSGDSLNGASVYALIWVKLQTGNKDTIWKGDVPAFNMVFDASGKKLIFQEEDSAKGSKSYCLYSYQSGDQKAVCLVSGSTKGMDSLEICNGNIAISKSGKRLFFYVNKRKQPTIIPSQQSSLKVNIWSYEDEQLQSEKLNELGKRGSPRNLKACIDLESKIGKVILLENEGDRIFQLAPNGIGEYALACSYKGNHAEYYWRTSARYSYYLVSLEDGSRRLIQNEMPDGENLWSFSGSGKYIIWYDGQKNDFITLNIATGRIANISHQIRTSMFNDEGLGLLHSVTYPYGLSKWLERDTAVLIYDKFDIWRVNPDGIGNPINITGGYGRKNRIILRLSPVQAPDGSTILEAFNDKTKSTGFFAITLNKEVIPHELTMGSFHPQRLIKAKLSAVYLIDRSNATSFPNWFFTRDFIRFSPITNFEPQKEFNWYKTELLHWKMFDGKIGEGILYIPEDFNPHKKYPVIFLYYERVAYQLNRFLFPGPSKDEINIPWFVSRGYLVFTPDIYYRPGYPGWSAYNSVVSSAKYLSKMPWVDSRHLGLQGHSFGGFETNYIVTKTNIFAAAVSAAGLSDLVSYTFGLRAYTGESNQQMTENSQIRIFAALWSHPELYIKNSPIFYVDKISTPMLIMHNENDGAVSPYQSIELFTALRRLGKQAWLLQYEDEGHAIINEDNMQDYSIRMEQFFNHYLKKDPAPKWMTKGICTTRK
jgi:dienelactone hydrolase